MKFAWIHTEKASFPVGKLCRWLGVTPSEVALAWVRDQPGVTAPVVGARTGAQLRTALSSLELTLPPEIVDALDDVSARP